MRWPVSFMLYSDPTRIYTEPVQASQVGLTHFRSVVLYKRGIFDTKPPNNGRLNYAIMSVPLTAVHREAALEDIADSVLCVALKNVEEAVTAAYDLLQYNWLKVISKPVHKMELFT